MIDADLRSYMKGVQTEEPPVRLADPRWADTESLARCLIEKGAVESALQFLEQEPSRKKRWDLLLLTALLQQGLGERARSLEALEIVGDKLLAAGDAEGVRYVLPRFLEPEPTPAAVRFLHYLAKNLGSDEERMEWLREALAIRPGDPDLHQEIAPLLERVGDPGPAREHRLRALELELDLGGAESIGEALFRAIDEDLPHAPERVARILLRYASAVDWRDSEPMLDLALPELETRVRGRISWDDLAPLGLRLPGTPESRTILARLFRMAVANEPDPEAILEGSGIADAKTGFDMVAARVPKLLALPPGAYVIHQTWGLGRVTQSDGESLLLDFPGRAGHKMSFAMATRSLDRLPNDGLRALAIEEPDRLRALAEAGDPELLVRGLRDVSGAATQAQLKPRLEAALPEVDWNAWWRKVKDRWKSDRRIDVTEAYRGQFRLALEGSEVAAATVPPLALKAATEGIQLVRKFLREHPEQEGRLREQACAFVGRWATDDRLDSATRAQALCYAQSWSALDPEGAKATLDSLIESGLRPDDLALGINQDQLLELSRGARSEEEFLWRAVESRLPRLREQSRTRLLSLLGAERYAKAIEQRIARPTERAVLSARLIEHFASHPEDLGAPRPGTLLVATIRLLEGELPDGAPERLGLLLGEGGTLREPFLAAAPEPEAAEAIERTVVHWSGSERRLIPVLDLLHSIGLAPIAEEYERRRRTRARELLEGRTTEDVETQFTLMSRSTYDRLQNELSRTARELKTSIPAAIEQARALGDLRENAEYEAAKQRQANAATRVQELMNTIQRARLIETLDIDASRVGVGTEAVLRPLEGNGEGALTFWILGEGDSGIAPGVLSYRAPLARPLLGKEVGAEVELAMEEGPRRFRVESIRRRLPGDVGAGSG